MCLCAAISLTGAGCLSVASPAPPQPSPPSNVSTATVEVVARKLHIPWDVAFLPNGDLLVTERIGTLLRLTREGKKTMLVGVPKINSEGEGGLLGLVLHPQFRQNGWLYLYLTSTALGKTTCRIERYRLDQNQLVEQKTILDQIPGATYHDGGRMAFGPDGFLYITTGDAGKARLAQDKQSLAGKILRLHADGQLPTDNPFKNSVWSYGHRNPQGITWDDQGRLWSTEHGRSGVLSGLDELNLIERGKNYGWPLIQGEETKPGMEAPKLQSGPDVTWAPASAAFLQGSIFFGGLRGERLYEADITGQRPVLKEHLIKNFGRIRTVVVGLDGQLYITTSNTDGRGTPRADDDVLLRVNPQLLRAGF